MPGLQSRPSKLHLIDDTTLTSLPFPPPAASKRLKRASSTCSRFTNNPQSTIPERQSLLSFDLSKDALEESTFVDSVHSSRQDTSELHNTCTYIDEAHEDSLEDAQDPIVLVEDYVTEVQSQKAMFRKKSLANIKKRLREKSSRATFCPTFGASQPLKIDFGNNQRVQFPVPVIEDLEAIFGKIPGTERLKYCTICDKPLYEISSVLSCSNPKDTPQKSNMTQHYQEFVCSDCIVTYEQILNELHEAEMNYTEDGDCQSAGNQRFSQILANNSILNHFDTKDPRNHGHGCAVPHTQKRRKFSNDLISRLHHLSAVSQPEPQPQSQEKTSEWLSGWSEKLKWNFNSILTNAFPPSERAT
ncbi:hypothetical protein JCM33374_g507 [Metschnikowia sp. JCM 33374]|nr:hypothetical protein JCM33374_g507 [Metschnikowia sp. JCM 33374]